MLIIKSAIWGGGIGFVLDLLGSGIVGGGTSSFTLTKWCFFIGLALGFVIQFFKSMGSNSTPSPTAIKAAEEIEEIYNLAKRNKMIYPIAIHIFPRRISSNYLAYTINLTTNLSNSDISWAKRAADESRLYLQASIEEYGVVLNYDSPKEVGSFQSFSNDVWKELKRRHPDWPLTESGIRF